MRVRRAAAALVAAATLSLAACTGSTGVDLAEVPAVDIDYDVVPHQDGVGGFVVLGDVLIASGVDTTRSVRERRAFLARSHDFGGSWEVVDLPGAPEEVDRIGVWKVGSGVAVSAWADSYQLAGYTFLWTSSDGTDWRGGPVRIPASTDRDAEVIRVWSLPGGSLLAYVEPAGGDAPRKYLRSSDGVTWQPSDCPNDSEYTPPLGCHGVERHGGLWVRSGRELSDDEGETWFVPELRSIPEDRISGISLVERDGGGWLAVVTVWEDDGSNLFYESVLVRSDDGRQWEVIVGQDFDSRCYRGGWISTPVRLGARWLVAATCYQPRESWPGPEFSQLYLLSADGTDLVTIDGSTESDHRYRQPVAVRGGVIVVAEFGSGTDRLLRFGGRLRAGVGSTGPGSRQTD